MDRGAGEFLDLCAQLGLPWLQRSSDESAVLPTGFAPAEPVLGDAGLPAWGCLSLPPRPELPQALAFEVMAAWGGLRARLQQPTTPRSSRVWERAWPRGAEGLWLLNNVVTGREDARDRSLALLAGWDVLARSRSGGAIATVPSGRQICACRDSPGPDALGGFFFPLRGCSEQPSPLQAAEGSRGASGLGFSFLSANPERCGVGTGLAWCLQCCSASPNHPSQCSSILHPSCSHPTSRPWGRDLLCSWSCLDVAQRRYSGG